MKYTYPPFRWLTLFAAFFFPFLLSATPPPGAVIYVNQNATGGNDGSSWLDAYIDLQDALQNATSGVQVWVAQGIYLPGTDTLDAFVVDTDLQLLGGFQGGEFSSDQRDPELFPTILSGDLMQDDITGNFDTLRLNNSRTVLLLEVNLTQNTVVDGFIISGGHAIGDDDALHHKRGGGVFSYGRATIRNCVFTDNYALSGGGIYYQGVGADGSSLQECTFLGNRAEDGGALMVAFLQQDGLTVTNCHFENNLATDNGGAIRNYNALLYLVDSQFESNVSWRDGGALEVQYQGYGFETTLDNCDFIANSSSRGGAIRFNLTFALGNSFHAVHIDDCFFGGNAATLVDTNYMGSFQAGAISFNLGNTTSFVDITLTKSYFVDNHSDGRGGAVVLDQRGMDVDVFMDDLVFMDNTADEIGGIDFNLMSSSTGHIQFEGSVVFFNEALAESGGMAIRASDFTNMTFGLEGVEFRENLAGTYGGGLSISARENGTVNLTAETLRFDGNQATERGGAIAMGATNPNLNVALQYIQFVQNSSPEGSAFAGFPLEEGDGTTEATAVSGDHWLVTEQNQGSLIRLDSFTVLGLTNSTLADNNGVGLSLSGGSRISLENTLLNQADFPELEDLSGDAFVQTFGGNLVDDASMNAWMGDDDLTETDPILGDFGTLPYTPQAGSPAVDAGKLTAGTPDSDIYGNPRVQGNGIDIGAVESALVSSLHDPLALQVEASLFPNPTRDWIMLKMETELTGEWMLSITDVSGKLIKTESVRVTGGIYYHPLSLSGLAAGSYQILLQKGVRQLALQLIIE